MNCDRRRRRIHPNKYCEADGGTGPAEGKAGGGKPVAKPTVDAGSRKEGQGHGQWQVFPHQTVTKSMKGSSNVEWLGQKDTMRSQAPVMAMRCYTSHPVLKLGKGKLYGGSARFPVLKDADVYVVLQAGDMNGWQSDPWDTQTGRWKSSTASGTWSVPSNVARFKKLVTWLCTQLQRRQDRPRGLHRGARADRHGALGYRGRDLEEKDAIQYVRKHYCKKAVESKEQVQFLRKHYGVSGVEPTKDFPMLAPRSSNGTGVSFAEFALGAQPSLQIRPTEGTVGEDGEAGRRLVLHEVIRSDGVGAEPVEAA